MGCMKLFKRWANETHWLAVTEAYGHGLTEGQVPSAEYIANLQQVSRRQIALGGYRLADILRAILPKLPRPGLRDQRFIAEYRSQQLAKGKRRKLEFASRAMLATAGAFFAGALVLALVSLRALRAVRVQRAALQPQHELLLSQEIGLEAHAGSAI